MINPLAYFSGLY